jgi:KDO2-lipid IV(A) lauroyltransferase
MIFKYIAYYFLVLPISFLPLRILYLISDLFFLLLISIVPYSKKVIRENLLRSFPKKSEQERRKIEREFYHFFTDQLAEGVKNLSISKNELKRRLKLQNHGIIQALHDKGKSIILVGAHYNNWEWIISAQSFLFPHRAMGIGQKMTDGFWDKKINGRRERFGMTVMTNKTFKSHLQKIGKEPCAILTLSDQSPGDSNKSYWTSFLNQPTAVLFGAEMMANEYNMAVVYMDVQNPRRGKYTLKFDLISENPRTLKYGEITENHVHRLESSIKNNPSRWLWSHKRWKRERPENWDGLLAALEKRFYEKYPR